MESENCAHQRKQPCALNFTVSSFSKITSTALCAKFYRTIIFMNSKKSENCVCQRKQHTQFTRQNKFCSPNGYERDALHATNKACRVRETFSCRIHRLHDTPFSYSHYETCIITRVPTFAVAVYDKLFTGKRGARGVNRVNFVSSCNIPTNIAAIRYVFSVCHFSYSLLSFAVSSALSAYHRSLQMQKNFGTAKSPARHDGRAGLTSELHTV